MRKFLLLLLIGNSCYADCEFVITNDSKEIITAEAGFFNKDKINVTVEPAMSAFVTVKNNDMGCNYATPSGVGVTYVNLVGGQSNGGWVYSPMNHSINARGQSATAVDGKIGTSSRGAKLFLLNNNKPTEKQFVVQIKSADRNISRQFGSMN